MRETKRTALESTLSSPGSPAMDAS
jgi:hypothetical protein